VSSRAPADAAAVACGDGLTAAVSAAAHRAEPVFLPLLRSTWAARAAAVGIHCASRVRECFAFGHRLAGPGAWR